MFKKKPNIKTLSPLRSSDRRKTADRIISEYGLQQVPSSGEDADPKAPTTSALTALRNSLLPENSLSAKFTTTSGPDLKEVVGTVYIGSHGTSEQRVLWVGFDDKIYPTVYTLWNNSGCLPLLHTPSMVVKKLQGGADLMTPGLAGPPFPLTAKKGSIVAIASLENPSVPVVVGTCVIDVSSLKQAQGAKGHAVETLHWAGDELWDWSTTGKSGFAIPEHLDGWIPDETETLVASAEDMNLEEEDVEGGVVLINTNNTAAVRQNQNHYISGEEICTEVQDDAGEVDMTTDEIDSAFRQAFHYGIHLQKRNHSSEPKFALDFPLTQSFVMSTLVLPFLPAFTANQSEQLVIKKTSWKNVRKFIKSFDKQGMLVCKDRPGNEVEVLDIHFDHTVIQNFQPYTLPKKESSIANGGHKPSSTNSDDSSVGQKLQKYDLYKPKELLASLFKSVDANPKNLYTASEIRLTITSYVETNNLVSEKNKRLATLDPILANAVLTTTSTLDAELLAKGSVPRDVLVERVTALCTPYHSILRNDGILDPANIKSKAKAGLAPKVGMVLETRSGNKTVTRVHGLEPFFVNPQLLADELRRACASSTSVEPWRAGPGGKGLEVMVQGPQSQSVLKALEKRGVLKGWVEVVDKTKKGKK